MDRKIKLLRPEEWHGIETLAPAEYISRRGLSLALGYHPVLNAKVGGGPSIGI